MLSTNGYKIISWNFPSILKIWNSPKDSSRKYRWKQNLNSLFSINIIGMEHQWEQLSICMPNILCLVLIDESRSIRHITCVLLPPSSAKLKNMCCLLCILMWNALKKGASNCSLFPRCVLIFLNNPPILGTKYWAPYTVETKLHSHFSSASHPPSEPCCYRPAV